MILHKNIESFKNIISQCAMKLGYKTAKENLSNIVDILNKLGVK